MTSGGSVTINISDCEFVFLAGGEGAVDGGSFGLADFPNHGTASTRHTAGQWFLDYTHNGSTGIGSTDVFENADGSLAGNGDIQFTITINASASPITVSPASLPTLTAGTPFAQTLTSSGGTGPYTYALQSGVLPPGLSLTSGGVLSGTPTQRGAYTFSVRSTDSAAVFADRGYGGTVQNPSLSLVPPSATAIQGVAFSQVLSGSGGVAPYSFLEEPVIAGYTGLPAGISLAGSTISGTTGVAPGNYNTRIRVTESSSGPGVYFEVEDFTLTVSQPPSVSIAVSPSSVSEDGATNLTFTVTRSLNLSSATSVNISTGGTATSGVDYTGGVATVNIPAGATTATITINPSVDGFVEANETVILTVAAGTGYTVGASPSNTATGTILNDDVPVATLSVSPAAVTEDGVSNLIYTVTLNQANASAATSVNYTISGTATNVSDYVPIASPVVIAAGDTTGTITVNPVPDANAEADETVTLSLSAGSGYTVGVPNSATGTILNDDVPVLTISDASGVEGDSGTTTVGITISLNIPAGPGGVPYTVTTASGTATSGTDFVGGTLNGTIPAGSSSANFNVAIIGDTLSEANENFFINVSGVSNATVVDSQALITITDDDALPSLSVGDVTLTEGNSGTTSAVFTVTLSPVSGQTVSVNYATADNTATQPADYTNTSGTLNFAPGTTTQTITVPVVGETAPEANETFFVNLSGAVNATLSDAQGQGTITNDDVPVTVSPVSLPGGAVATAYSQTVTASGAVAPYSFAPTAGALPAGLSLSSGGVISGTPTAGGSFNFTVTATDSSPFPGPFAGSRSYTLTIAAPTIVLPATPLAGGTLGAPYSATINAASGGTAPYAYTVTGGALPGGLGLNAASGAITGTPSAVGTFNFDITATDSSTGTGPYTATQSYAITTIDVPPTASNSALTVAYNAAATNVPLSLTGGAPTAVAIGTAPTNGTAVAAGTAITYQPTAGFAGTDSFTYTATNSGGTSTPATVTVTVSDPVITITPSGGFSATVGAPYTQTFTWNGGAQPWSGFQVTNLPAGLSITGTTANSVTVSGTPTQAGSFNLNASATDSSTGNGPYTVGQAFTLTVAAPGLSLAPAGPAVSAPYGVALSQSFTASGGIGPYTYVRTGALPAGVSFTGNTVSGTPSATGVFNFTITATDTGSTGTGAPFTVARNYSVTVAAPTITLSPPTVPNPTAGAAYSQTVTASGGIGPYGFAVTGGALPTGLTLSTAGVLSGTTNQVGTFNFTVTATDANAQTGARAYAVTVAAPTLTLTPASGVLTAPYGVAYSQSFVGGGGSGSFTYALTAGPLPAGLTFSGNTISGTPTATGSFPVTVTATDSVTTGAGAPFTVAQNYTVTVSAPTIVVSPASLPNPAVGTPYSQTFAATGGVGPYSFALTAGALPSGLAIGSGGAFTGTPTQVGSFNFTVTATDNFGQAASRAFSVVIGAPTLTMAPAAGALTAPYGVAYLQVFTASGSPGPFIYAVTGALPAGLAFSGNTLSGTPSEPGTFPITVTATDTHLTGVGAPFTVANNHVLSVAAPVFAVSPTTLPEPVAGEPYSQQFTASGGVAPYRFALTSGSLPTGLSLSSSGLLSGRATQVGTFSITVTVTDANLQSAVFNYELRSTGSPRQSLAKQLLSNADEDGNGKVSLGDTLTYRITLSNTGFVPLSNVVVNDAKTQPSSTTCASVLPGQSCVLQGNYTVTADDVWSREVVNVATVSNVLCAAGSQDVQCRVTLSTEVIPAVVRANNDDFGEIMCPKGDVVAGNAYKNDTIDGQPIRAADFIGTVTSAAKAVKAGKPVPVLNTATGEVKVPAGTPGGTYTIGYKICQRSVSNNCDTATIVVKIKQCQVLVRVIKTANVKQTRVGEFVSYSLQIDNLSENETEVEGLQIIDTPPPGFSLVPGSARFQDRNASGTVSGTGPITLGQIDLEGNGKAFITYVIRVGAIARRGDAVNTAIPLYEGEQVGTTAKAVVTVAADPDTDETSVIGKVFIDQDGDGWQDSADATDVRIQGGIDPSVYLPNSTTVDRGQGAQPEPDASAPLLRGIRLGTVPGRNGDDPSIPLGRMVVSQWVSAPVFTGDSVITTAEGARLTVKSGGEVVNGSGGDVAAGLSSQDLRVERKLTPQDGKYRVDYIITNHGVSEQGIPGVRLASPEGLVVQTDSYGRFHLEGIDAAARAHGRNFVLKVDPVSLPQGARVTTENPLVRRLTGGLMVRFDFGVGFDK